MIATSCGDSGPTATNSGAHNARHRARSATPGAPLLPQIGLPLLLAYIRQVWGQMKTVARNPTMEQPAAFRNSYCRISTADWMRRLRDVAWPTRTTRYTEHHALESLEMVFRYIIAG